MSKRAPLTARQYQVISALRRLTASNGYQPSLRELGAALDPPVTQTNAVSDHLKALERKGWIKRTPGRARGIEVLK